VDNGWLDANPCLKMKLPRTENCGGGGGTPPPPTPKQNFRNAAAPPGPDPPPGVFFPAPWFRIRAGGGGWGWGPRGQHPQHRPPRVWRQGGRPEDEGIEATVAVVKRTRGALDSAANVEC